MATPRVPKALQKKRGRKAGSGTLTNQIAVKLDAPTLAAVERYQQAQAHATTAAALRALVIGQLRALNLVQ